MITENALIASWANRKLSQPREHFAYSSVASWPLDDPRFENAVRDGILDAVLIDLACGLAGIAVTLEAIGWHELHSVPRAYYGAAREALLEIFAKDQERRLGGITTGDDAI
jgi:hypothetical protein